MLKAAGCRRGGTLGLREVAGYQWETGCQVVALRRRGRAVEPKNAGLLGVQLRTEALLRCSKGSLGKGLAAVGTQKFEELLGQDEQVPAPSAVAALP